MAALSHSTLSCNSIPTAVHTICVRNTYVRLVTHLGAATPSESWEEYALCQHRSTLKHLLGKYCNGCLSGLPSPPV